MTLISKGTNPSLNNSTNFLEKNALHECRVEKSCLRSWARGIFGNFSNGVRNIFAALKKCSYPFRTPNCIPFEPFSN